MRNLNSRLDKIEAANPPPKPPMCDEDFIEHGIAGRQIVAALQLLESFKADAENPTAFDPFIRMLRDPTVPIEERHRLGSDLAEMIRVDVLGQDPDAPHPMPAEVASEMYRSCDENRLPVFPQTTQEESC